MGSTQGDPGSNIDFFRDGEATGGLWPRHLSERVPIEIPSGSISRSCGKKSSSAFGTQVVSKRPTHGIPLAECDMLKLSERIVMMG
ncbi:hypothetical protein A6X21_23020 [Planctopirus hydrillae]|uniref:Uncharacterized protein n=1 Tax=Planctopirus hydrillae TaxID=1841610 RepID=A0A1C3ECZ3_9PLAN|nr:hypothetical protein A6X21_23020 [Planctopirus hydrillae]